MPDENDETLRQQRLANDRRSLPEEVNQLRLRKYAEGVPKHYVRKIGWLEPVKQYVQQMQEAGVDRPIKYLTLPGAPAIDIGVMWKAGIIHRTAGSWPYVAICDREDAGTVISNLGVFAAASDGWLHHELRQLRSPLVEFFPIDVVNLDFYGTFIQSAKEESEILKNIGTLRRIVHLQRGQGFLLLLTHKVSEGDYSPVVRESFKALLEDNLQDDRFKHAYRDVFGGDDPALCMRNVLEFGMLAVPKVIAQMASEFGYQIKEEFAGWYTRPDEDYQMAVHSIVFYPVGHKNSAENYSTRYRNRRLFEPALSNLPDKIRSLAQENYWMFISQLPARQALDIQNVLSANRNLEEELRQDAEAMQNWWLELGDEDVQTD